MSKKNNEVWQKFLNSFFEEEGYMEKQVNGYWLVKHYDANTREYLVSIYTRETFAQYKRFSEAQDRNILFKNKINKHD